MIGWAANLQPDIFTVDCTDSLRGGLKCFGHAIGGSGLRMIYEVYKQLQGKAGPRQCHNPSLGLTHNIGGRPGSFTCSVAIFGRDLLCCTLVKASGDRVRICEGAP